MVNKKKQERLTKEFLVILDKAQAICEVCHGEYSKLDNQNVPTPKPLFMCMKRNQDLYKLINETSRELGGAFDDKAIQTFQSGLDEIFANISEESGLHQKTDVVSKHLSVYAKFEMEVINALRRFCQGFEAIFAGDKLEQGDMGLNISRSNLATAGLSQFLPRPMKSLNDAKEALDDISTRLNECIELNNREEDEDSYRFND
jgi:hypothetical protein|tara:strand:+ start:50099 stop:50704 length:606 start_codon:yes stop_codon:yes gene_type:complete